MLKFHEMHVNNIVRFLIFLSIQLNKILKILYNLSLSNKRKTLKKSYRNHVDEQNCIPQLFSISEKKKKKHRSA